MHDTGEHIPDRDLLCILPLVLGLGVDALGATLVTGFAVGPAAFMLFYGKGYLGSASHMQIDSN